MPQIEVSRLYTPWGDVWRAWDDSKGADSGPYGQGMTRDEAIADLERQLEEMEE